MTRLGTVLYDRSASFELCAVLEVLVELLAPQEPLPKAFWNINHAFQSGWFISNFQKTLKRLVLALPKSYSIFNKTVSFLVKFCALGVGHSCL